MTITYVGPNAWGSGKGAPLSRAEHDGNVRNLDQRIVALETNPPEPNEIEEVQVTGSQMTFVMQDASTFGPFTLPTSRWVWRGDWAASTVYAVNDFLTDTDRNMYLVLRTHTSEATFDPNLQVSGGSAYELIMEIGNPAGWAWQGTWASNTAYTVNNLVADVAGTIYLVLQDHTSAAPFDAERLIGGDPVYQLLVPVTQAVRGAVTVSDAVIEPTLEQAGFVFLASNYVEAEYQAGTDFVQFVIPANEAVPYPVGTQLHVVQTGNTVEIVAGSGVSIIWPTTNADTPRSRDIYSMLTLTQLEADYWAVSGDLELAGSSTGLSGDVVTLTGTTYTARYDHRNSYFRCTHASGCTITLSTGNLAIGTELHFRQCAAGQVTISTSGITLNAKSGSTYKTAVQGSVVTVKKVGVDTWDFFGDEA